MYAIANRCTHARASLSEGTVDPQRCAVTCPWHEGVFSLENGRVLGGPPVHAVAVSSDGYSLRFGLGALVEPSTRAGRRYARPAEGAEIMGVARVTGEEIVIAATSEGRGLLCKIEEINFLSGPGKGVLLIKRGGIGLTAICSRCHGVKEDVLVTYE